MSIHPSLNISDKDNKARSVLKRTERIRAMIEKNRWKTGDNVYGLPKMKTLRIKIKKEKTEKTAGAAATTATPKSATAAAPKEQAAAKAPSGKAPAKGQEKK